MPGRGSGPAHSGSDGFPDAFLAPEPADFPQGIEFGFDSLTAPGAADIEQRALREAIRRIDMLERTLIAALKENAGNWARAERAEDLLTTLERQSRKG